MNDKTVNEEKPEIAAEITPEAQLDFDVMDELAQEHETGPELEVAPEPPQVQTRDILAPLIHMGFQILAPNWDIQKTESGMLAEAYADVLDKYFPDGIQTQFGPEIAAITCTAMVVMPRLKKPRKKAESKKPGQKGDKDNKPGIKPDIEVKPEEVTIENF